MSLRKENKIKQKKSSKNLAVHMMMDDDEKPPVQKNTLAFHS